MHRARALVVVLVLGSLLIGCFSPTDPLGREEALEDMQRKYTDLVRWGDLDRAGVFVEPELRDQFMQLAGPFSKLRVTDVEIGDIVYGDMNAIVTVTYKGYSIAHLVEHTSRERQEWVRRAGLKNVWHVRPQLDVVLAELRGLPRSAAER